MTDRRRQCVAFIMNWEALVTNKRITDYSFAACAELDNMTATRVASLKPVLTKLWTSLFKQCTGNEALYSMSNWEPHRLSLMANIAWRLRDRKLGAQVHVLVLGWPSKSECVQVCKRTCGWRSQDYHHRDSITYVVYGWWALARAAYYLQDLMKYSYKSIFTPLRSKHAQYVVAEATTPHLEFAKSKILNDRNKEAYGKPYDVNYFKNFEKWYARLK